MCRTRWTRGKKKNCCLFGIDYIYAKNFNFNMHDNITELRIFSSEWNELQIKVNTVPVWLCHWHRLQSGPRAVWATGPAGTAPLTCPGKASVSASASGDGPLSSTQLETQGGTLRLQEKRQGDNRKLQTRTGGWLVCDDNQGSYRGFKMNYRDFENSLSGFNWYRSLGSGGGGGDEDRKRREWMTCRII